MENIDMVFDIPCSGLFYETFQEIREFGSCIENLLETSLEDVVWCLREIKTQVETSHCCNSIYETLVLKSVSGCSVAI